MAVLTARVVANRIGVSRWWMRPTRSRPSARKCPRSAGSAQQLGDREVPEVDAVGDQAQPGERRCGQHPARQATGVVAEDRGRHEQRVQHDAQSDRRQRLGDRLLGGERLGDAEQTAGSQQDRQATNAAPAPSQHRPGRSTTMRTSRELARAARDGDAGHRQRHPERQPGALAEQAGGEQIRDDAARGRDLDGDRRRRATSGQLAAASPLPEPPHGDAAHSGSAR